LGKKRVITKTGDKVITTEEGVKVKLHKKSVKRRLVKGLIFVRASFNNTIVTITDEQGNVIVWSSAGNIGFKGTKKSTPYAATLVGKVAAEKAKIFGFREGIVYVRGLGPGREAAIRDVVSAGIDVVGIIEDTPVAHGGVKPPKPRRV